MIMAMPSLLTMAFIIASFGCSGKPSHTAEPAETQESVKSPDSETEADVSAADIDPSGCPPDKPTVYCKPSEFCDQVPVCSGVPLPPAMANTWMCVPLPPAECPPTPPQEGQPCSPEDLKCTYGYCGSTTYHCFNKKWSIMFIMSPPP